MKLGIPNQGQEHRHCTKCFRIREYESKNLFITPCSNCGEKTVPYGTPIKREGWKE